MLSPEDHPYYNLSPEQILELKLKEAEERCLRIVADFENLQKRSKIQQQETIQQAEANLLKRLIPVLDSFDFAVSAIPSDASSSLKEGVVLVHKQFLSVLAGIGLEEIDAVNQKFDPNWHEALSQQETNEVPSGHVMMQVRRGYRLNGKLVRPAGVVVSRNTNQ